MITKKADTKKREFKNVSFDVLATGEKSMVTKMNYKIGDIVPLHSHPNEQCGYVISGKHRIRCLEIDEILIEGDSYSIPENIPHSWEVIEAGEAIDVFTPPRQDYLQYQRAADEDIYANGVVANSYLFKQIEKETIIT